MSWIEFTGRSLEPKYSNSLPGFENNPFDNLVQFEEDEIQFELKEQDDSATNSDNLPSKQ